MVVLTIRGIRGTIRVHNQRIASWLRKLYRDAVRGDVEAQSQLGAQLESDDIPGLLPVDNHAAFKWHLRAARGGSPGAWSKVAYAYKDGLGVRRDRRKAFAIVLASAHSGDLAGVMNLGRFYRDGVGVKKNAQHGIALLEEAVRRGFSFAAYDVAEAYRRGNGVRKSLAVAAHWLRIAAFREHPYAAYELAIMYEYGRGVQRTPREAFRFMKLAAEFGDVDAYHSMGWYLENGFGCRVDERSAIRWYRRGANGNAASAINLALLYARGSTTTARSLPDARKWLRRALALDPKWARKRGQHYGALRPLLAAIDKVGRRDRVRETASQPLA